MVTLYEDEEDQADHPNGDGTDYAEDRGSERPNYEDLFGAPDFSTFIKKNVSRRSREYERKVQSMLKSGVVGAVNMGDFPDAAAFLKYGPAFARATGELADHNAKTREMIDMLTAPDSPVMLFAAATIPLIAQLWRNHEPEVQRIAYNVKMTRRQKREARKQGVRIPKPEPKTIASIKIFGKRIPVKVRVPKFAKLSVIGRALHARAQSPQSIVNEVFSNPKVVKSLRDLGAFPESPAEERDNGSRTPEEEEASM